MKKQYKQYYDTDTDIFWVVFKRGAETRYEEIAPAVTVEFNKNSEVIGIEIQEFSRLYSLISSAENTGYVYNYPSIQSRKYRSFANFDLKINSTNSLSLN